MQEQQEYQWRTGDKKLKLQKSTNTTGTQSQLEFMYNPLGQRVLKIRKTIVGGVLQPESAYPYEYTFYAYDANGQVMATYKLTNTSTVKIAELDERMIYGAGRLGTVQSSTVIYTNQSILLPMGPTLTSELGRKQYELTNHLGNVNAVITDRKMVSAGGAPSTYEAVVIMKADYYPFGMTMGDRYDNSAGYRYAYNGMEVDPEMKGDGNSYTTEFRQYDPRLGRWASIDPLKELRPSYNPYNFGRCNPIIMVDPSGLSDDWYEDQDGNIEWRDDEDEYFIEFTINKKGQTVDTRHWKNIGKQLSEEKAQAGWEFFLFKQIAYNYSHYKKAEVYDHLGLEILTSWKAEYYHPLMDEPGFTEDRITSDHTMFAANEGINDRNFADVMIGSVVGGAGPENFYFGPESSVSQSMVNSYIVEEAFGLFLKLNEGSTANVVTVLPWTHFNYNWQNAALNLLSSPIPNAFRPGSTQKASVEQVVGSAAIKIAPLLNQPRADVLMVSITIFNVTSVGSGSTATSGVGDQSFPRPLNVTGPQPYTNISQTIEIHVPIPLR